MSLTQEKKVEISLLCSHKSFYLTVKLKHFFESENSLCLTQSDL